MYLEHLIARALKRDSALQPRRASRFEPGRPFTGIASGDVPVGEEEPLTSGAMPVPPRTSRAAAEETYAPAPPANRAAPNPEVWPQLHLSPGPSLSLTASEATTALPTSDAHKTPRGPSAPPPERRNDTSAPRTPLDQEPLPLPQVQGLDVITARDVSSRRGVEGHIGRAQERPMSAPPRPRREEGEPSAVAPSSSPQRQPQQETPQSTGGTAPTRQEDAAALASVAQRLDALAHMIVTRAAPQPTAVRSDLERAQPEPTPLAPRPALPGQGAAASNAVSPEVRPAPAPSRRIADATTPPPSHEPTIQITIGRIEVRATAAAPSSSPRKAAAPRLSLDEYLRRREAHEGS
jgi:hypothetical protein